MSEAGTDPQAGSPAVDWEAIERSPDFRALVASRQRFAMPALAFTAIATVAYVLIVNLAPGITGASVFGEFTFGFLGGVLLVFMSWAITLVYMRKSDREWGPMERRVVDAAGRPAAAGEHSARDEEPVP